jgi:hypothetical protein
LIYPNPSPSQSLPKFHSKFQKNGYRFFLGISLNKFSLKYAKLPLGFPVSFSGNIFSLFL